MRVLLVFPPQAHFTQPFLALPSLKAYLQSRGYQDVHVMDASIEAYDYFLRRERLEESLDALRRSGRLHLLEEKSRLGYTDMVAYRRFSQVHAVGDWVLDHIDEAKATLRSKDAFYDYEKYMRAGRCIEQALAMISAEHHPSDFTAHGFSMRHSIQSSDDILAGAANEGENPFVEFYREVVMPRIRALDPDVVGMSLTLGSQAIPTVSLAAMIKEWKPSTHVVVGGGLVAYIGQKLKHRPDLFDTIDTLVRLEGERPLTEIVDALQAGGGPDRFADIANILYRDGSGAVRQTAEKEPLPMDSLPPPDFEGLPLDLYLSPDFVIPLAITRGCYWGKCVFCTLHKVIGEGYRGRSIEKVVADIRYLKEKWNSNYFYFPIEDIPPHMIRRLPSALLDAGLDIEWWCDAKLEPDVFTPDVCEKLWESGCRRLAFGFESASQRVLDLMCKGSSPDPGVQVIRNVHDAGISVTLYVMVGFPTETEEEARETLHTLLANREHFEEVSIRVFYLDDMSDVFKTPQRFDIVEVFRDDDADLQVYYDFRTGSGMTRAQARRVYLDMLAQLESHLPVFRNRNVLYHELKSHYFLYLAKAGGVKSLLASTFATPPDGGHGGELPDRPQIRRELVLRETRFDREEVDDALDEAQDGLTLPRYQFDLITGEAAAKLDRSVRPVKAAPSAMLLDPTNGQVHHLSRDALELLHACNGETTVESLLERYEEEHHDSARDFLRSLAEAGLFQAQEVML